MTLSLVETGDCEIRRWTPRAGDVLVVTCEQQLNRSQVEQVRAMLLASLPPNPSTRVLVLCGGMTVEVLSDHPDFWCSYASVKQALDHVVQAGPGAKVQALRMLRMWGDGS